MYKGVVVNRYYLERCRENDHSSSGNRISTFRWFNMGADYFKTVHGYYERFRKG